MGWVLGLIRGAGGRYGGRSCAFKRLKRFSSGFLFQRLYREDGLDGVSVVGDGWIEWLGRITQWSAGDPKHWTKARTENGLV